jgi:hypothetical protein
MLKSGTNTLAYYDMVVITTKEGFITFSSDDVNDLVQLIKKHEGKKED